MVYVCCVSFCIRMYSYEDEICLVDRVKNFVQSGKGGDGMSSFRHENVRPQGRTEWR